ncbi:MAG TPA: FAD-dependent monooxygenase [Steroidobacteraceae bacterium]|nr:FAD-dependent monooxygenase [Steroidobacteraceae bacterium]
MNAARHSETPVLIIGAGAAGLTLTLELARRGIACRTIDKLSAPSNHTRAFTLHARTIEMLERIDRGLADRYLARGIRTKGMTFTFEGTRERPVVDFSHIDSRYAYLFVHNQHETEGFIREHFESVHGYRIDWNTRLIDFEQRAGEVIAHVSHTDRGGEEEIIRCRWLVACDGAHSSVREKLGLDYRQSEYKGLVLQNMDVDLEGWQDEPDWVHYYMGKDNFLLITRLPGGHCRLMISDMGQSVESKRPPREVFQEFVNRHCSGVKLGEPHWATKWTVITRLTGTYRSGNIFLAGDSAHVHSTSGGQGMNCCMQDAHNLGWKLAYVEKGWAPPALLDSYEAERHPIGQQVIQGASALHEIILAHGTAVDERMRRVKDPEWLAIAAGRISGIAYTYRSADGAPAKSGPAEGPWVGDRAPDVDFTAGGALFDHLRHPVHTLLLMPANDGAEAEGIARECAGRFGSMVRTAILPADAALARRYGQGPAGRYYLIRPDGYVGARGAFADRAPLVTGLAGLSTASLP